MSTVWESMLHQISEQEELAAETKKQSRKERALAHHKKYNDKRYGRSEEWRKEKELRDPKGRGGWDKKRSIST